MRRRTFIAAIASAAIAWPAAAPAQQPGRLPTIGFLGSTTLAAQSQSTAAFVQGLAEFGWIEGRTVTIEYRWAEGRAARAAEIAAEFVRLKVNVILTNGTPMIMAAKRATSDIPIVFAVAGDPVSTGLVASLSRPGGNLTGSSLQSTDMAGKHLELLREVLPGFRRLLILVNVDAANAVLQMREAQAAARTLGIDVEILEIRSAEDIASALDRAKGRADALFVMNEPLVVMHRAEINLRALAAGLPTVYAFREFVDAGGLMSYGPSFPDLFRRAAHFVDRILRGGN